MDETRSPGHGDGPSPSEGTTGRQEREPALTQEQEALRALWNVQGGADPAAEAFALSNRYTDRHLQRLGELWARLRRRR